MNVGELIRERDRLIGVIDEAKTARVKLRQLNVIIAMYGDQSNVTHNGNGKVPKPMPTRQKSTTDLVECGKCHEKFARRGIGVHNSLVHGGKTKVVG